MTHQVVTNNVVNRMTCLVNGEADCNRLWIAGLEGLHAAYFLTTWKGNYRTFVHEGVHEGMCKRCVRNRPAAD